MSNARTLEITQLAQRVLFGQSIAEKLTTLGESDLTLTDHQKLRAIDVPNTPSRPFAMDFASRKQQLAKVEFPDLKTIHLASTRGEILHFFANHELLAMELMALMLLRFPDAPAEFRLGVAHTLREEQSHMSLYLTRMKELGVNFGDLPMSSYFWRLMSSMKSPLEFVTQMSLTFEQANLDFSLYYKNAVQIAGDEKTAVILDRVYREEIGHVRHGLKWFNLWRQNEPSCASSDWEAYLQLLPVPLTPRRAKGISYSEDARREAGLSETFIQELKVYSGGKGRPPVLWYYNPFCESEIARGKPGFTPKANLLKLSRELEHLPLFLAHPQDCVLVTHRPSPSWLDSLIEAGFEIPEFARIHSPSPAKPHHFLPITQEIREPKLGGFKPWGWSPETFELFKPLQSRLSRTSGGNAEFITKLYESPEFSDTHFAQIFSKSWQMEFYHHWLLSDSPSAEYFRDPQSLGKIFNEAESAKLWICSELNKKIPLCIKAPLSSSGAGVKRVLNECELDGKLGKWIKNLIDSQKTVVVEPWLDKVHDVSIQFELRDDDLTLSEVREFLIGPQNQYQGTCLGHWKHSLETEAIRTLTESLPHWKILIQDLAAELSRLGYQGPAGMDAMIYRERSGKLRLRPWVELNPRYTMGAVALALEKNILPGTPAQWRFFTKSQSNALGYANLLEFAHSFKKNHPVETSASESGRKFIKAGAVITQEPQLISESLTILIVGESAIRQLQSDLKQSITP